MKQLIAAVVLSVLAVPALSMDMDFEIESVELFGDRNHHGDHSKPGQGHKDMCPDLNFSPAQMNAYREARNVLKTEMQPLGEKMKQIMKRYRQTLVDIKAPVEQADRLSRRMGRMLRKMMTSRMDFFHAIVYDVASIDQREPLLKCMAKIRHHMKMKQQCKNCKKCSKKSKHPQKPDEELPPVQKK